MNQLYIVIMIMVTFCISTIEAAEFYSADVKISSVNTSIGQRYVCTVSTHNDNDDTARNTVLLILFPLHVKFLSSSATCKASPSIGGWHAFATCRLGPMNVGQTRTVKVETTLPPQNVTRRTCGAFVWSQLPDPDRSNNYLNSAEP